MEHYIGITNLCFALYFMFFYFTIYFKPLNPNELAAWMPARNVRSLVGGTSRKWLPFVLDDFEEIQNDQWEM